MRNFPTIILILFIFLFTSCIKDSQKPEKVIERNTSQIKNVEAGRNAINLY